MFALLNQLQREQELLDEIKALDADIETKKSELKQLYEKRNTAENKLNQYRGFIRKYFKELFQEDKA